MLVESRAPDEADGVAGLQRRAEPRRAPAADEAEMAAMRPGHRLDDRRLLAVPADADDEPFVPPLHAQAPSLRSAKMRRRGNPRQLHRHEQREDRERKALPRDHLPDLAVDSDR